MGRGVVIETDSSVVSSSLPVLWTSVHRGRFLALIFCARIRKAGFVWFSRSIALVCFMGELLTQSSAFVAGLRTSVNKVSWLVEAAGYPCLHVGFADGNVETIQVAQSVRLTSFLSRVRRFVHVLSSLRHF